MHTQLLKQAKANLYAYMQTVRLFPRAVIPIPIFPELKALMPRIMEEEWKHGAYALSRNFPRFCPNYRLYDLRHTFITRTKECGVHDELVSLWTGHELGKSVTANVYTHYQMSYQQEQALKVEYEL